MNNTKIFKNSIFSSLSFIHTKGREKGRTKAEVDTIICWLTGYDTESLQQQLEKAVDFETFFLRRLQCFIPMYRKSPDLFVVIAEEIEDKLMQKIRYLDKLVDELAKGRDMEKILRK